MAARQACLAIDLGGSKLAVGVVDPDGRILEKSSAPTDSQHGAAGIVDQIASAVRPLIDRHAPLTGAGMTLPGLVDPVAGRLLFAPYSGLSDIPIAALVAKRIGLPVRVENDVNACAWAERWFGTAKEAHCFLWVTVSTGIGAGIVSDGRLLRGAHSMAGEIGHIVVEEGGALCGCGNHGCLEAEAAGPAWARRARLLMAEGRKTLLRERCGGDEKLIDARMIAEAAREGDPLCHEVVDYAGTRLSRGLAAFVNLLDPDLIVIGGGVGLSLDLLRPVLERELPARTIGSRFFNCPVAASALGYDAALIGAASLQLHPMALSEID